MTEIGMFRTGSWLPGQFGLVEFLATEVFQEVGMDLVGDSRVRSGARPNRPGWGAGRRVVPESAVFEDRLVEPSYGLGRAISYMLKLWKGLTLFLEDPRIPLDNNAAERALRGVVVGRKNHYGSKSKRGTEVAALFYTLFETAKLSGVDPRSYVTQAAWRAIAELGTVTLPSNLT